MNPLEDAGGGSPLRWRGGTPSRWRAGIHHAEASASPHEGTQQLEAGRCDLYRVEFSADAPTTLGEAVAARTVGTRWSIGDGLEPCPCR